MDKKKLKNIVLSLMIEPEDFILEELIQDFEILENNLKILNKIDTTNIKPMYRINETPISLLREDTPHNVFKKADLLNNAPKKDQNFVLLKRVVK